MAYQNYDDLPLCLSVKQVAEVLGIGRNTAYDLVRSGQIQSVRTGRQIRISKDAMISFFKQH
ncbi:MAG: helix-turn-helix domain-containing protein [Oscillospiraceae bacterium]|nr:helix-turn-helix domain-containing protein [Oscillospiraceae bacterium]